ncbi:MAG: hypothetical protein ACI8WM_001726 [Burkholderiaceae bacterium]|jgi:hypothetical protein
MVRKRWNNFYKNHSKTDRLARNRIERKALDQSVASPFPSEKCRPLWRQFFHHRTVELERKK